MNRRHRGERQNGDDVHTTNLSPVAPSNRNAINFLNALNAQSAPQLARRHARLPLDPSTEMALIGKACA